MSIRRRRTNLTNSFDKFVLRAFMKAGEKALTQSENLTDQQYNNN